MGSISKATEEALINYLTEYFVCGGEDGTQGLARAKPFLH